MFKSLSARTRSANGVDVSAEKEVAQKLELGLTTLGLHSTRNLGLLLHLLGLKVPDECSQAQGKSGAAAELASEALILSSDLGMIPLRKRFLRFQAQLDHAIDGPPLTDSG
jgi:hypothetical protein